MNKCLRFKKIRDKNLIVEYTLGGNKLFGLFLQGFSYIKRHLGWDNHKCNINITEY